MGSTRIVFKSRGFRQILNEPGVATRLHREGERIAAGVSASETKVSGFTMRGGSRKACAVHTRAKNEEQAYEARRELAASAR